MGGGQDIEEKCMYMYMIYTVIMPKAFQCQPTEIISFAMPLQMDMVWQIMTASIYIRDYLIHLPCL